MTLFAKGPSDVQEGTLRPLGDALGLDWLHEAVSPTHRQFAKIVAAAGLLWNYSDPLGFPSHDRRTSRRGAKALSRAFAHEGGQRASIMLAFALGALIQELEETHGRPQGAVTAAIELCALGEYWTLRPDEAELLERSRAEFRVLTNHEIDPSALPVNGYHCALLFGDRGDPSEDHDLVRIQRVYASQFMRRAATVGAIEIAVGPAEYSAIAPHIATIPVLDIGLSPEEVGARAKDEHWWTEYAHNWADSVDLGANSQGDGAGSDDIPF